MEESYVSGNECTCFFVVFVFKRSPLSGLSSFSTSYKNCTTLMLHCASDCLEDCSYCHYSSTCIKHLEGRTFSVSEPIEFRDDCFTWRSCGKATKSSRAHTSLFHSACVRACVRACACVHVCLCACVDDTSILMRHRHFKWVSLYVSRAGKNTTKKQEKSGH